MRKTFVKREELPNWDKVKNYLFFVPMNFTRNKDYLIENDIPYFRIGDMAVTVRILMNTGNDGYRSFIIDNGVLDAYEINFEELKTQAYITAPKLMIPQIVPLETRMTGKSKEKVFRENKVPLLVGNIKGGTLGSSIIFYRDTLRDLSRELGYRQLLIIPESVDEVLIKPMQYYDKRDDVRKYWNTLQESNKEYGNDGKVLSDNLYIYYRGKNRLYTVDEKDIDDLENGRIEKPSIH